MFESLIYAVLWVGICGVLLGLCKAAYQAVFTVLMLLIAGNFLILGGTFVAAVFAALTVATNSIALRVRKSLEGRWVYSHG
jgi:hypothetical protein